jgi:hypothetical protein
VIGIRVCGYLAFTIIMAKEVVELWRAVALRSEHPLITSEHVWMFGFALVSIGFANKTSADWLLNLVRAVRGKVTGTTDEHRRPKPRRRKPQP